MPHYEELVAQVYELPEPSSTVAWGDITGTLADQTDLQAALDSKLDDSQADTFGLVLLATATAADARAALALVPGTDVQPYDADLTALAGLATAADTLPYFTGSAAAALTTFTAFARTLLDDANALTARATLGVVIGTDVQAQDAELQAIAGLVSAADRLPYFTGSGTAALATFTAGGRALVNSAGTADTFPYFSASNTVTLGSITAAGRALIDDATAADQRTTLGLGSSDSPTFAALTVTGLSTLATLVNTGALQATKTGAVAITPQWQMNGAGVLAEAAGSTVGLNRWSNNTGSPGLVLSKSRGATTGTHAVVAANDILGRIGFNGSDGAAFFEGARIEAFADATIGTGSVSGRLVFSTTAAAGGSATTALTLGADQSAAFAAHVNAPTTMVIGNTAAIPANCRVLIDGTGSGTLPTLSGGTSLALQRNNAVGNNNFLAIIAGTSGIAAVRFGDSGSATQGRIDYDNATDGFSFYTAGSSQLTLSSGGVLSAAGAFNASSGAFNTTTLRTFASSGSSIVPVLQANGTSVATSSIGIARWNTSTGPATIALGYSAAAAVGTQTIVADTNVVGRLSFDGSDGAAFQELARIEAFVNGTPGANDMPGALRFMTTPDGSTTPATALTIGQDKVAAFAAGASFGGDVAVTGGVSVTTGITGANIYNTYTPTLTGITNVAASAANVSGWIRIGNAVLVFTRVEVTATASATLTEIDVSLPVASNFSGTNQCVGSGAISSTTTEVAAVGVQANTTDDRAKLRFVSTSTSARFYTVVFGYIVI